MRQPLWSAAACRRFCDRTLGGADRLWRLSLVASDSAGAAFCAPTGLRYCDSDPGSTCSYNDAESLLVLLSTVRGGM